MDDNIYYVKAYFSNNEWNIIENFKEKSGMTYKAIAQKALDYTIANDDFEYVKNEYVFYEKVGGTPRIKKSLALSKDTNTALSEYCKEKNTLNLHL